MLLGSPRAPWGAATGEAEALRLLGSSKVDLLICANNLDQGQTSSLITAAPMRVEGLRVVLILAVLPVHFIKMDLPP